MGQAQAAEEAAVEEAPVEEETAEQPAEQAAPVREAEGAEQIPAVGEAKAGGLWYEIKWGDTLWDIAATYYRNPWLYPKIARENRITNPDLIFAGTRLFIPEN